MRRGQRTLRPDNKEDRHAIVLILCLIRRIQGSISNDLEYDFYMLQTTENLKQSPNANYVLSNSQLMFPAYRSGGRISVGGTAAGFSGDQ